MKKIFKTLLKVILYMFIGAVIGGLANYSDARFNIFGLIESLGNKFLKNSYMIFLVWTLGVLVLIVSLYLIGKRKVKKSLAKEDELIDDNCLGLTLIIIEVYTVLSISLFFINLYSIYHTGLDDTIILALLLLIATLSVTMIQYFTVEFIKTYNPEKQGDVINLNFNKKWIESSDEREKQEIFEAGYKAFYNMQIAIVVMLVAFAVYTIVRQNGMAIILALSILYLIGILSYFRVIQKKKHKK